MRKLIVGMSISADGFVCGPNHEIDWILQRRDASVIGWIEKSLWEGGVHIMGSRTFQVMASYWPFSTDPLAAPMNQLPKVIFSKGSFMNTLSYDDTTQAISPHASTWAAAPVATDLVADITKLKQAEGKPIIAHGGASFVQDLVKHGLVDEYQLRILPVVIGKGMGLFATTPQLIDLQLVSSTPFSSGTIANIYVSKAT